MKNRLLTRFISLIISLALVLSLYYCFPDSIIKANSTDLTEAESVDDTSDTISDNPFDKQDDMEVPYDRTRWVQPKDWNTPKIDPRDYDGGIMLYFDKIGLDPEYAKGKVQRVYFSITGATEPVSYIKFHVFYDTRLTVKENSAGMFITPGKGLNGFTTGSAKIEDGQLAFYAYAEDTLLNHSCLFTIDFIVPENAEQGEVYPIGLAYTDDGIVADTFINSHKDEAGKLQMTYVFTKGIYNGYIRILGEKKTTTTTTTNTTTVTTKAIISTTAKPTTTTTPLTPQVTTKYSFGDPNGDNKIDANDATLILINYSILSTGGKSELDPEQQRVSDVNSDGKIDAADATAVLQYYAYLSTGGTADFKAFLNASSVLSISTFPHTSQMY